MTTPRAQISALTPDLLLTVVSGEFQIGSQYHFHLETQTCIVTPEEDGVSVISTTQYMDAGVMRRDISYLI